MKKEIKDKIKKANNVFVWVELYDSDGDYIKISKSSLQVLQIDQFENDKFVLRQDGDLYIN
jgi:hypothetical protein